MGRVEKSEIASSLLFWERSLPAEKGYEKQI
jgi:hypothetical protein